MEAATLTAVSTEEMSLASQLARHDVKLSDIRYVLHTHHHIDHAGQDSLFADTTTVITNRREL